MRPAEGRPDPAPPAGHPSRSWWGAGRALLVTLAAVTLLAVGLVVGLLLGDDDSPSTSEPAPVAVQDPVEASIEPPPPTEAVDPLPVEQGPVVGESAEPVAAVAAAVAPAVVRIDTGGGTGSGIIYDESGLVVTNAHVVGGFSEVDVQLANGTRTSGTVIGTDPNVDIAVVQIDPSVDFEVAVFAPTSTVEVGQLAVAIGSPFGLEQSVTAGIISAVNRAISSVNVVDGSPTIVEMVQTDAPINPGNSGGALADRQGRVVGVNTSIRTDGTTQGNLGVGFAIPSDTALLVAGRIVAGEPLDSGFLGVSGQDPADGAPGALITDVVSGGPAEEAGLEAGDLIIGIDGSRVPGMTELAARIRLSSPGSTVAIEIVRGGQTRVVDVVLGTFGES